MNENTNNGAEDGNNNNNNNDRNNDKTTNNNQNRFLYNLKGEVPSVGATLGTHNEQGERKDRFKNFQDKLAAYIKREYEYPEDIVVAIKDIKDPLPFVESKMPTALTRDDISNPIKVKILDEKIKKYVNREETVISNKIKLYSLVWGQCSRALQSKIKGDPDYENNARNSDIIWLLDKLRLGTAGITHTCNPFNSATVVLRSLFTARQNREESVEKYRDRFEGLIATVKLTGFHDIFQSTTLANEYCNGNIDESEH
jgi:hypothetical protein